MLGTLKRTWKGWKRVAHGINAGVSWVLMGLAYFLAVGPVALCFKLTRRDMLDRGLGDPDAETHWKALPPDDQDVRRAQRPW